VNRPKNGRFPEIAAKKEAGSPLPEERSIGELPAHIHGHSLAADLFDSPPLSAKSGLVNAKKWRAISDELRKHAADQMLALASAKILSTHDNNDTRFRRSGDSQSGDTIIFACSQYDKGRRAMAVQIATAARLLFNSTPDTDALVAKHEATNPLKLRSTTNFSVSAPTKGQVLGFMALHPSIEGFQPNFGTGPRNEDIPLNRWWREEPILSLMRGPVETITRRQLILTAANVGAEREAMKAEDYERLKDGLGLEAEVVFRFGGPRRVKFKHADLAAIRQIGHEILASPDIRKLSGLDLDNGPLSSSRPLPPKIGIEPEMNQFVKKIGGKLVTEVVGNPSPSFLNADYAFIQDNIIAELKCLNDDKTVDKNLERKIQKLLNSLIDSRQIPDPGPGIHVT
jgi:hypothetical protein